MATSFIDPFKVQQIRVAVDCVCICKHNNENYILLIKRNYEPYKNHLALPGGFLKESEELEEAVIRELKEETNINKNIIVSDLKQIGAYGKIGRDPRPKRIVSIAYLIQLIEDELPKIKPANESLEVLWVKIDDLQRMDIAFDHDEIIKDATTLLGE